MLSHYDWFILSAPASPRMSGRAFKRTDVKTSECLQVLMCFTPAFVLHRQIGDVCVGVCVGVCVCAHQLEGELQLVPHLLHCLQTNCLLSSILIIVIVDKRWLLPRPETCTVHFHHLRKSQTADVFC